MQRLVAQQKARVQDPDSTKSVQLQIWIPILQVGAGQEIRTEHFQTVGSGSVAAQHQSRRLDGPLNNRGLDPVQFEVDNFPRLRFPPSQFLLDTPAATFPLDSKKVSKSLIAIRSA